MVEINKVRIKELFKDYEQFRNQSRITGVIQGTRYKTAKGPRTCKGVRFIGGEAHDASDDHVEILINFSEDTWCKIDYIDLLRVVKFNWYYVPSKGPSTNVFIDGKSRTISMWNVLTEEGLGTGTGSNLRRFKNKNNLDLRRNNRIIKNKTTSSKTIPLDKLIVKGD